MRIGAPFLALALALAAPALPLKAQDAAPAAPPEQMADLDLSTLYDRLAEAEENDA